MLLHQFELFWSQFSGLEQNRIRNADLADIVQLCGGLEGLQLCCGKPEFITNDAGIASDADDMVPRVIVAKFRRAGQTVNDLHSGLLQIGRSLANGTLKFFRVTKELILISLDVQDIADASQQFTPMNRFGQQVRGSAFERFELGLIC